MATKNNCHTHQGVPVVLPENSIYINWFFANEEMTVLYNSSYFDIAMILVCHLLGV